MATATDSADLRKQAVARLKAKRDFQGHLLAFVLINGVVWLIWALTGTGFPWPAFMTAGWGVGVIFNAWDVYLRRPFTEAAIDEEMRRLAPH